MGDIDHGLAEPAVQLDQLRPHMGAQLGVEIGERLVEQEHLRLAHQRPAERHALLLAAGKLPRLAVEQRLELQELGRRLRPSAGALALSARRASSADRRCSRATRHMRIERIGLEHHGDVALAPAARSLTMRSPMRIAPAVGYSSPASMRSVVVLPQPEGPSRLTNSPDAIARSRPGTATAAPNALRTLSNVT